MPNRGDRLHVHRLHDRDLRDDRDHLADDRDLRVLRRGTTRAADLQRHGHRRRLDERGLVHQHGGLALRARLRRARVCAGLDRRLRARGGPAGAVSAQVRHLHRARLPGHPVRRQFAAAARHHRAVLRELHLHRLAARRRGHHHLALPADPIRRRRVRRPRRRPGLLDAGRDAGGDLDPGRPVHHPDHRLHRPGGDPVGATLRPTDPAADLRPGAAADRRARAASSASSRRTCSRS